MQDNDAPLVPPSDFLVLEGYDFSELLCSSPLARTSRYFEPFSNTYVVVKEIQSGIFQLPGVEERLQERLAQIIAAEHPDMLRLLGHGRTDEGGYYIIREHVDGSPLREWMQTTGIDHSSALNLVITLAGAIEAWHQHGSAHGAVSDSNVWIDNDNGVKLEIFPVSSLLNPTQLVHLLGLEVVDTMPPEFTSSIPFSPQSDIYALAAIYHELLTGSRPRGAIGPISPTAIVDSRIRHVISKALSQSPSQRQASMTEFCSPLVNIAAAGPVALPLPAAVDEISLKSYSSAKMPLIAILSLVILTAGMGWYLWKREPQKNSMTSAPEVNAAEVIQTDGGASGGSAEDEIPSDMPIMTATPRIKWHETDGDADHLKIRFSLESPDEILPLIQFSDVWIPDRGVGMPAVTNYQFEDAEGRPVGNVEELVQDDGFPLFQLELDLSETVPPAVRLVLTQLKEHPPLASNLVSLDNVLAEHRLRNQPSSGRITVSYPLPNAPRPSLGSGDAYIFAAHFYLGSDVSLLKLQFGNAGEGFLMCDNLAFQFAFSTDDRPDALLPADADALPSPGLDLAAGGFTSKWLGMQSIALMPQKKLWTKHTFRIDTSNPEVLEHAKFLLVTISPFYSVTESNYQNNVIAIPLDHPGQWHSVTQDPTDSLPADGADPDAPLPAADADP